jgi:hypothetical protein
MCLTPERPGTLNAISPIQPTEADERTARHLRLCAELTDLAMQLARAAAARTLTNWAEPEQPPAAQTQSIPMSATHSDPEAAPQSNPAPTRGTTGHATPTASYKPTDPAVLFTRLAAVVRDCVALEARLTAGTGATTRAVSLQLRADPRRAPVREAFRQAIENHPDRAELLRETTTRLDEQLANDPDQTIGLGNLLFDICNELGIEVDLATVPDEFLTSYSEPTDPDEAVTNAPYPRATSPP